MSERISQKRANIPASRKAVSGSFSSDHWRAALMLSCSASRRSKHASWSAPVSSGSASSASARKYSACSLFISSASPLASSLSRANSWTVSSITKRGSPLGPSSCLRRLLSSREERPSRASKGRSPSGSHMASMASRVRPPENTARRAKSTRSPSSSSAWLHSMVPLRVRCRSGRSRAPPLRSFRRLPSRSSIAEGVSSFMRAAASSMARGSPSSLAQISATAGAFPSMTEKSGLAALARSIKSLTASYWLSLSIGGRRPGRGSSRGGPGYLLEVVQKQQQLLVAEVTLETLLQRLVCGLHDPERFSDSGCHQGGVGHGGELHEEHAVL